MRSRRSRATRGRLRQRPHVGREGRVLVLLDDAVPGGHRDARPNLLGVPDPGDELVVGRVLRRTLAQVVLAVPAVAVATVAAVGVVDLLAAVAGDDIRLR